MKKRVFLFISQNIWCGYSKAPKHMDTFIDKNIMLLLCSHIPYLDRWKSVILIYLAILAHLSQRLKVSYCDR